MPGKAQDLMFAPGADKTFWSQPIDQQIKALSALNPEKTKGVSREAWQQYISDKKPQAEQLFGNIGSDKPPATPATPPTTAPPSTGNGYGYAAKRGLYEGTAGITHLTGNVMKAVGKVTGSKAISEQANVSRAEEKEARDWLAAHPQSPTAGWMEKLLEGTVEGGISAVPYAAASGPIGIGAVSAAEHADEGVAPALVEGVKSAIYGKGLGKISEKLTPAVEKVLGKYAGAVPAAVKRAIAPGTASAILDYALGGGDPASAAAAGIVGGVQGSVAGKEPDKGLRETTAKRTEDFLNRLKGRGAPPNTEPTPPAPPVRTVGGREYFESPPSTEPEKKLSEKAEEKQPAAAAPPSTGVKTPEQELAEARAENARLKAAGQPPKTAPPKPKKVTPVKTAKTEEKPVATPAPEPKAEPAAKNTPLHADTHREVGDVIEQAAQSGIGKITIMNDRGEATEVDLKAVTPEQIERAARELGESKELTVIPTENTKGLRSWKRPVSTTPAKAPENTAQFDVSGLPVKGSTGKAKIARRGVEPGDTITYLGTDGAAHLVGIKGGETLRLQADSVKKLFGEPEAAAATEATPKTPDLTAKLPAPLAKANPRYRYGEKAFTVKFANDIDRAAYITAQPEPSKADAKYLKFAMDATGMTEDQVRDYGREVRAEIKAKARKAEPGEIEIEDMASTLLKSLKK